MDAKKRTEWCAFSSKYTEKNGKISWNKSSFLPGPLLLRRKTSSTSTVDILGVGILRGLKDMTSRGSDLLPPPCTTYSVNNEVTIDDWIHAWQHRLPHLDLSLVLS
jgi:hypothetical protein